MATTRLASPALFATGAFALPLLFIAMWSSGYVVGKLAVPAGEAALIVGTMPVLTLLGAGLFLGEKTSARQWLGMAADVLGVVPVVWHKLGSGAAGVGAYAAAAVSLLGITLGTLYQKKFCAGMDLRTGGCVQLAMAALVALPLALVVEGFGVQWTPTLLFASGWLSLVNSIGATSLLFLLMRKGDAGKVASLFYLIPGVTALMAYAVLGETLTPLSLAGFAATAGAVWLCTRSR
jgi:drug/metabolite transporter (DMT)-like permease